MGARATRLAQVTLGTTGWCISMGRRQVIEGANASLKGGFVNIEGKFVRVLGVTKMTVLLAFTIAGYSIDRIRAYATQGGLEAEHEKEDEGEAPSRNMDGPTRGPALLVWPGPARLSSRHPASSSGRDQHVLMAPVALLQSADIVVGGLVSNR